MLWIIYWALSYHYADVNLSTFIGISSFDISQTVAPKPINYIIFQKTELDLSVALKYFAQTAVFFVFFFALISRIYEKLAIFDILMTIYLGGNIMNR